MGGKEIVHNATLSGGKAINMKIPVIQSKDGRGEGLFEISEQEVSPAKFHLAKSNIQVIKIFLTPEEFEDAVKEENANMENYPTMIYEKVPLRNKDMLEENSQKMNLLYLRALGIAPGQRTK